MLAKNGQKKVRRLKIEYVDNASVEKRRLCGSWTKSRNSKERTKSPYAAIAQGDFVMTVKCV